MKHKIEIILIDRSGDITDGLDFDTLKDAKAFMKEAGMDESYWNRRAESEDYDTWAKRNIASIQLLVDGDCRQEWFPKWALPMAAKCEDCGSPDAGPGFCPYAEDVHNTLVAATLCAGCARERALDI